jgi:ketosteroid isomerase-like protein
LSIWSGSAAAQDAKARSAIEAVNQQFMVIFKSADPTALTALYTSAGQLLPPHGDIVTGTQAINQFWQGFLVPGIAVTFKSLELETHGDTGHEVAYYTVTGEGNKVLDTGKYIVIWKREQGQWKLHRDIWNTNTPAPAQ